MSEQNREPETLARYVAEKFPLRDIRERVEQYDREHWDTLEDDDYIDIDVRPGDVFVDKDGAAYLIGDRNRSLGMCSCCGLPRDKVFWKGYIPFEDYANVKYPGAEAHEHSLHARNLRPYRLLTPR